MIEARKFSDGTTEKMLAAADGIIGLARKLEPDRSGGYLCIADRESGIPILVQGYGHLHPVKASASFAYASEKSGRLGSNVGHRSSWQSRVSLENIYGGAIRGKIFIFSFSGFSELLDEAAMLWLAITTNQLTVEDAAAIANLSNNHFFQKLGDLVENATQHDFGLSSCGGLGY